MKFTEAASNFTVQAFAINIIAQFRCDCKGNFAIVRRKNMNKM